MKVEQSFSRKVLHEHARLSYKTTVGKKKLDCVFRDFALTRGESVILFMNSVLLHLKELPNELIRLRKHFIDALNVSEMYCCVAVLYYCCRTQLGLAFAGSLMYVEQDPEAGSAPQGVGSLALERGGPASRALCSAGRWGVTTRGIQEKPRELGASGEILYRIQCTQCQYPKAGKQPENGDEGRANAGHRPEETSGKQEKIPLYRVGNLSSKENTNDNNNIVRSPTGNLIHIT